MNEKIEIRLKKEEKEKIKKLLLLDEFNQLNLSSLVRTLLIKEYNKKKKDIYNKEFEIACEEEGVPIPQTKFHKDLEKTIEIANYDWVHKN